MQDHTDPSTITESMSSPQSPCIGVCELDAQNRCIGCFRTNREIAAWPTLNPAEQRRILAELPDRADELFD